MRDHEGEVFVTLLTPRLLIIDPTIVEATVALMGRKFCQGFGYQKVELEGDAL